MFYYWLTAVSFLLFIFYDANSYALSRHRIEFHDILCSL